MTTNNRKCDDCGVKLHGQCIVDGSLLLCMDCAENLDMEREHSEMPDDDYDGQEMYIYNDL